ncbi:hypothetical protein G6F68_014297 [Rhizopus microsporus]|nr:hypothetical protein G6F68_018247 [Rhizopus microsporus]KAG1247215.1 hypothetical protein G6F68_014297 [Rhizopus microsporus]
MLDGLLHLLWLQAATIPYPCPSTSIRVEAINLRSECGVSRDTHSWMTHDSPACPYLGLLKASHLHDHTPPTWTGLSSLDILLVM